MYAENTAASQQSANIMLYTCVSISSKRLGHHKSSGPKSLVYCILLKYVYVNNNVSEDVSSFVSVWNEQRKLFQDHCGNKCNGYGSGFKGTFKQCFISPTSFNACVD